jgi:hypothetical protein
MPFPRPEAAAPQAFDTNQVSFTVEVRMVHGAAGSVGQHPGDTIALPSVDEQGEVRQPRPHARLRSTPHEPKRPISRGDAGAGADAGAAHHSHEQGVEEGAARQAVRVAAAELHFFFRVWVLGLGGRLAPQLCGLSAEPEQTTTVRSSSSPGNAA